MLINYVADLSEDNLNRPDAVQGVKFFLGGVVTGYLGRFGVVHRYAAANLALVLVIGPAAGFAALQ